MTRPTKDAYVLTDAEKRNAISQMSAGLRSVDDGDVLNAAAHFGISGYGARFLVVARAPGECLITEDARLRRAAPKFTRSLAEALVG